MQRKNYIDDVKAKEKQRTLKVLLMLRRIGKIEHCFSKMFL
jgi:hypothetical protein